MDIDRLFKGVDLYAKANMITPSIQLSKCKHVRCRSVMHPNSTELISLKHAHLIPMARERN